MEIFIIIFTIFFQQTFQLALPCLELKGKNHKELYKELKSLNLNSEEYRKYVDKSLAKGIILSSWEHLNGTEFYLAEYRRKRQILREKFSFHKYVLNQAIEDKMIEVEVKCYESERAGYFTFRVTRPQIETRDIFRRISWEDFVKLLSNLIKNLEYYSSLGGYFSEMSEDSFKVDAFDFSKPTIINIINLESFNSVVYVQGLNDFTAKLLSFRKQSTDIMKPGKKHFRIHAVDRWDKHTMLSLLETMLSLYDMSLEGKMPEKNTKLLSKYVKRIKYQMFYLEFYLKYNITWENIKSDLQEGLFLNLADK